MKNSVVVGTQKINCQKYLWSIFFLFSVIFNLEFNFPLSLLICVIFFSYSWIFFLNLSVKPIDKLCSISNFVIIPMIVISVFQTISLDSDAWILAYSFIKTYFVILLSAIAYEAIFLRKILLPQQRLEFFLKSIVLAILIQSIFVLISFFYKDFQLLVVYLLKVKGNLTSLEGFRVKGFANSGGANLSMALAFGAIISFYVSIYYRNYMYFFISLIIIISSIFVGRTGLVAYLITVPLFCFFSINRSLIIYFISLTLISLILIFNTEWITYFIDMKHFGSWWAWFQGDALNSLNDLIAMVNIDFGIDDLIFGRGYFEALDNENRTDIGYLKAICSVGIFSAMLFYAGIFMKYIRGAKSFVKINSGKYSKIFISAFLFTIVILEFKEAMLYQNMTGRMLLFIFIIIPALNYTNSRAFGMNTDQAESNLVTVSNG